MNASFRGEMGFGLTREASRRSDSSSSGIRGGGGGGFVILGLRKTDTGVSLFLLETIPAAAAEEVVVVGVAVGQVIVKRIAKGKQRSKAQKRERGEGDSMFFYREMVRCVCGRENLQLIDLERES